MAPHLLIISSVLTKEVLTEAPFSLSLDDLYLCTPASLRFISLNRFFTVILHDIPPEALRKTALGIRDDDLAEALWDLLHDEARRIYMLVPAPIRPPQDWIDLGIESILPGDLQKLGGRPTGEGRAQSHPAPLTAEDIHLMHRRGETTVAGAAVLTPWAREVADSLGMLVSNPAPEVLIVHLEAESPAHLARLQETIFAWQSVFPHLLFLVPPPLFPVFNTLYPSLRGRLVSPTIHWESKGAFTGEITADMLVDAGCAGALLPAEAIYHLPKHLDKIQAATAAKGLLLFARKALEPGNEYGIMTPPHGNRTAGSMASQAPVREKSQGRIARVFRKREFEALVARKGRNV